MTDLEKPEIKLWVDGSYQSAKRPAGVGIVITDMDNNLLEEHSFTLKGAKSAFDSELMSATIALSLPAVLNSAVKELHGDCMGVINFLNSSDIHHPFENTSNDRQDMADNAREVLDTQENLTRRSIIVIKLKTPKGEECAVPIILPNALFKINRLQNVSS